MARSALRVPTLERVRINFFSAPLPNLVTLRLWEFSLDPACTPALLAAAPNLRSPELRPVSQRDNPTLAALDPAKVPSLKHLTIRNELYDEDSVTFRLPSEQLVLTRALPSLRSLFLGWLHPHQLEHALASLPSPSTPNLTELRIKACIVNGQESERELAHVLREAGKYGAVAGLKRWVVATFHWTHRAGDVDEWHDGEYDEWRAGCEERGTEVVLVRDWPRDW